ncbi:MAG: TonB family protein [Mariprofundaceae bacterium]|nr:TonB family protein [Mariprofundaceae bacterium]
MSQSLAAKRNAINDAEQDGASLQTLDILFAVCMHVLIVAAVLILSLWHKPVEFHPQSIQVSIISAQQLKKMQHRAHPPAKAHKKKRVIKPKIRPKPKTKAKKPVLKLAKPKAKAKTRRKVDPNFDPFKPMASSSDVKSSTIRKNSNAAEIFSGQLSKQEINRYIALIQDAVQRHWKVAAVGRDVRDPLVEMILNPGGSVLSVRVIESSGNVALDASLIRAIQAASPFQVPVKQFELFRNNRIRFRPLR